MALNPSKLLLQKVQDAFPKAEDAKAALVVLGRFVPYGGEGLQLAAIRASSGQLWKLRELARVAKKDFRDVFFEANSPEKIREIKERRRADPTWGWGRQQYSIKLANRKANGSTRRSDVP